MVLKRLGPTASSKVETLIGAEGLAVQKVWGQFDENTFSKPVRDD
jgi:hypothetical protein